MQDIAAKQFLRPSLDSTQDGMNGFSFEVNSILSLVIKGTVITTGIQITFHVMSLWGSRFGLKTSADFPPDAVWRAEW